jgi:hypothetical protein
MRFEEPTVLAIPDDESSRLLQNIGTYVENYSVPFLKCVIIVLNSVGTNLK